MMSSIFNVQSAVQTDDSIRGYSYRPIYSYNNQFKENDQIVFTMNQKEVLTLPHKSQLYIELSITRPAKKKPAAGSEGSTAAETEKLAVKFATMGALHLFSKLSYLINGQLVDEVNNVGVTAAIKSAISITNLSINTYKNVLIMMDKTTQDVVSFTIPLVNVAGFFEDFHHVAINAKQDLILVRSQTNLNALNTETGVDVKITNLVWQLPFVEPNDVLKLKMMKIVKDNTPLAIAFRNWSLYTYPSLPQTKKMTWPIRTVTSLQRPRFVIVGFQTKRENNISEDTGYFDHASIKNVNVFLGSERFPYMPFNVDFSKNLIAPLLIEVTRFREKYYGTTEFDSAINYGSLVEQWPLWVIDTRHQADFNNASSNVDIKIEIESESNFPAETNCHCLILSDRMFEYFPFSGILKQVI